MTPPVTNPHDNDFRYVCELCDPPFPIGASSQKELDRKIADHNATVHGL